MQVKIKKLVPEAVIPKYAKPGDAGLDLTAVSCAITDHQRVVYGTGLAFEIPEGHVGLLFPRSSISKVDLRLTNCVGVIDSGYRGEVKFVFEGVGLERKQQVGDKIVYDWNAYGIGDRIGQLLIMSYPQIELVDSEELSSTHRGEGGFGSSGK